MALSTAEAARQRKQLLREIAATFRAGERQKIRKLKGKVRGLKGRRSAALKRAIQLCRRARRQNKERAKEKRAALRQELKDDIAAARFSCSARKAQIRQTATSSAERARRLLTEERSMQREIKRIEQRGRARDRLRSTAAERRGESDDAVRHNIPAELRPLFERMRRHIKGSTRQSRTEEFLKYAEEHPAEVFEVIAESTERDVDRMVAEFMRSPPPELMGGAPF